MDETNIIDVLKNSMNNKTKQYILSIIIFIIIGLVIIDQIVRLTSFIINYDYNFNYGRMLKQVCGDAYFEYETERYNITQNLDKYYIKNDNFYNQYYQLIYAFSIIVGIIISFVFALLFIDTTFSISDIFKKVLNIKKFSDVFSTIFESIKSYNIINVIYFLIKVLLIFYIILIIPIYLILAFTSNVDISPFNINIGNIISHTLIFSFLFLIKLNSKIFSNSDSETSMFIYYIFLILYICVIYFITNITKIYIKQKELNDLKNEYEGETTFDKQTFYYKYNKDSGDTNNIIYDYILSILGLNNINISYQSIFINSLNGFIAIFGILVITLIIIYYLLEYFKSINYTFMDFLDNKWNDSFMLYYFAIIPFTILFIIFLVVIATKEYNTLINRNMIYKPTNLYKNNIYILNDIFKSLIKNDEVDKYNKSIQRNVANGIFLTLFTELFNNMHNSDGIDIIPELKYDEDTYVALKDDDKSYNYNSMKEYDIDYYLNNKTKNSNIFYVKNNCNNINEELLATFMFNSMAPFKLSNDNKRYDEEEAQFILKTNTIQLYITLYINSLVFTNNILNNNNYIGSKELLYSNNYETNNRLTDINEIYKTIIKNFDYDTLYGILNKKIDEYDNVIINILKSYINMKLSIYIITCSYLKTICQCNNENDIYFEEFKDNDELKNKINTILKKKGDNTTKIKKKYIVIVSKILKETFTNINDMMSNKLEYRNNYILTNFIIKNYNNVYNNEEDQYKKKYLIMANLNNEKTLSVIDTHFYEIKNLLDTNFNDITLLFDKYQYVDVSQNIIEYSTGVDSANSANVDVNKINLATAVLSDEEKMNILNIIKKYSEKLIEINTKYAIYIELYKEDSSRDYKNELTFNNNKLFIEKQLKLQQTLYKTINDNINKLGNTVANFMDNIVYIEYTTPYYNNITDYNKYNEALNKILNNEFMKELQDMTIDKMKDIENYSINLNEISKQTSSSVYILVIVYLIIIYISGFIE